MEKKLPIAIMPISLVTSQDCLQRKKGLELEKESEAEAKHVSTEKEHPSVESNRGPPQENAFLYIATTFPAQGSRIQKLEEDSEELDSSGKK
ncbi:hypothetical protein R1flu_005450 [Riccia fluitans]|uniref:Uncharacterized protein n=1 Tax=Riccia fluitans TaxID=41844 RepID=A0ABD1YT81_9MARC